MDHAVVVDGVVDVVGVIDVVINNNFHVEDVVVVLGHVFPTGSFCW